ncbi:MAG: DUF721 domain-containing protein [Candidatus Omnitrophica bacterium]|nr:DUF721 domain-containing protein [Candidatus Omnitrophota bacterium]
MKNDGTPIKDITGKIIKEIAEKNLTKKERVEDAWQKAAEKRFWPHTQPASFIRKRLVVNVDSSGWLYELTMSKWKITSKLSKILKDDFRELQFRIGKIER